MGNRHLYFVGIPSTARGFGTAIYSYDLSTGRIQKVVEGRIVIGCPAPSPDEKHLLYGVVNGVGGDLLMINGLQKR
jgi:hypothetical protein